MCDEIAPDHDVAALLGGARVGLDAGDAMADVGGVGRLAHLAVADNVDAGRNLLGDDLVDRLGGLGLEDAGLDALRPFPGPARGRSAPSAAASCRYAS